MPSLGVTLNIYINLNSLCSYLGDVCLFLELLIFFFSRNCLLYAVQRYFPNQRNVLFQQCVGLWLISYYLSQNPSGVLFSNIYILPGFAKVRDSKLTGNLVDSCEHRGVLFVFDADKKTSPFLICSRQL